MHILEVVRTGDPQQHPKLPLLPLCRFTLTGLLPIALALEDTLHLTETDVGGQSANLLPQYLLEFW